MAWLKSHTLVHKRYIGTSLNKAEDKTQKDLQRGWGDWQEISAQLV